MKLNIIEDNELVYTAKVKERKVTLNRSKSSMWSERVRGERIGKITDNGNRIKINFYGNKLKLEYHEFAELLRLMNLKMDYDKNL